MALKSTYTVVLPTRNEYKNLLTLIPALLEFEAEILVVDDSTSEQHEFTKTLEDTNVRVIEGNHKGLADAIIYGIQEATTEKVVVMDADWQHPPYIAPVLAEKLNSHDIAIGVRNGWKENAPVHRRFASWFADKLAWGLTQTKDRTSGLFAIRKSLLSGKNFKPQGFKALLELLVKTEPNSVAEVPYDFGERKHGESKFSVKETLRYLVHLGKLYSYKYRFNWFLVVSLVYMSLTIVLPVRRTFYKVDSGSVESFLFHVGQPMLMVVFVLASVLYHKNGWFRSATEKLISPIVAMVMLFGFILLQVTNVPGFWWTWFTLGLHILVIYMGRLYTRNPFIPLALVLIGMGGWEIVYQYSYWFYYNKPQNAPLSINTNQAGFMSLFIFFGLFLLYLHKPKLKALPVTRVLFVLALATFGIWFSTGLWTDVWYDWSTEKWVQQEPNNLAMSLYRSSKVFLNLTLVSLIAGGRHVKPVHS